jgi:hypothetical protein
VFYLCFPTYCALLRFYFDYTSLILWEELPKNGYEDTVPISWNDGVIPRAGFVEPLIRKPCQSGGLGSFKYNSHGLISTRIMD